MARELAISLYLFIFKLIFNLLKQFRQRKKTVFIASFGDNILFTLEELEKQTNEQAIILKTPKCRTDFSHTNGTVLTFSPAHFISWLKSIYHLATGKTIMIDNYFGFLAAIHFHDNVKCIQLWHAAGAIKRFGLKDPTIETRSKRAVRRFQQVYHQFTHVVVGSDKMAAIFKESFGLSDEHIIKTGIPRTDIFYNESDKQHIQLKIRQDYPTIKQKKVILYAPTYRDDDRFNAKIALDIDQLYHQLHHEYVLFLKLHPAVQYTFHNQYADFVYDVSHIADVNHLLFVTDILITDYSSIPFEFALLERPMIFFAYDLDEYEIKKGFWEEYETNVPGPVVSQTTDIVDVIDNQLFNPGQIKAFSQQWNTYSNGSSSKALIEMLYKEERELQPVK